MDQLTAVMVAPGGMWAPATVIPRSAGVKFAVVDVTVAEGGGVPVPPLVTASWTVRPATTVALLSDQAEPQFQRTGRTSWAPAEVGMRAPGRNPPRRSRVGLVEFVAWETNRPAE